MINNASRTLGLLIGWCVSALDPIECILSCDSIWFEALEESTKFVFTRAGSSFAFDSDGVMQVDEKQLHKNWHVHFSIAACGA